jgi:hypothetical protein
LQALPPEDKNRRYSVIDKEGSQSENNKYVWRRRKPLI